MSQEDTKRRRAGDARPSETRTPEADEGEPAREQGDAGPTREQLDWRRRVFYYRAYSVGAYLLLLLSAIAAPLLAIVVMQFIELWTTTVPVVDVVNAGISLRGQGIPVTDFLSSIATVLIAQRLYRLIRKGPPKVRARPKN